MTADNLFSLNPAQQRQRERFARKSTAVAENMLRRVRALSHCPEALDPFLDTLRSIFVDKSDVQTPNGLPTVGTYCVMVPPDLVYAHGAMPVRLCSGSYTALPSETTTRPGTPARWSRRSWARRPLTPCRCIKTAR